MAVLTEMRLQAHEVDDESLESMVIAVALAISFQLKEVLRVSTLLLSCEGTSENADVLQIPMCPHRYCLQLRRIKCPRADSH